MAIDHEDVPMPASGVMVGMAMRFRSLPALVFVLMVLIVVVQVSMGHGDMLVLADHGVMGTPDKGREPRPRQRYRSQQDERSGEPKMRPHPARQRVGEEPASMRQRELRGKQRRAILGLARLLEQTPGGGHDQRGAGAEQ